MRFRSFVLTRLIFLDNNFDVPDRTFHKLLTTWQLASRDSTTDVKEMIPEFYFLPEFLKNEEGRGAIRNSRCLHLYIPCNVLVKSVL